MRKIILIVISVIAVILAGCGVYNEAATNGKDVKIKAEETDKKIDPCDDKKSDDRASDTVEKQATVKTADKSKEKKTEEVTTEEKKMETRTTESVTESRTTEAPAAETLKAEASVENESTENNEKTVSEVTTEAVTEVTTEAATEAPAPSSVSYSPQNVVVLATAKCQAGGMVTTIDGLNRLLADGSITQEEYDSYYPYDGLGYYSVFVETDLNKASTTSGRLLGSEDGIATYIANMLLLETGSDFLIEYAGTYSTGGTEFYEFRCYR